MSRGLLPSATSWLNFSNLEQMSSCTQEAWYRVLIFWTKGSKRRRAKTRWASSSRATEYGFAWVAAGEGGEVCSAHDGCVEGAFGAFGTGGFFDFVPAVVVGDFAGVAVFGFEPADGDLTRVVGGFALEARDEVGDSVRVTGGWALGWLRHAQTPSVAGDGSCRPCASGLR